jgi:hypothetical protein
MPIKIAVQSDGKTFERPPFTNPHIPGAVSESSHSVWKSRKIAAESSLQFRLDQHFNFVRGGQAYLPFGQYRQYPDAWQAINRLRGMTSVLFMPVYLPYRRGEASLMSGESFQIGKYHGSSFSRRFTAAPKCLTQAAASGVKR